MTTLQVGVIHEITSQDVAYWVTTAFEGGSGYWIETADCAERTASGWHAFNNLVRIKAKLGVGIDQGPVYSLARFWESPNHGYLITPLDGDECVQITCERFRAGLQAMVQDGRHKEVARLLGEEYDADDADVLLQYTLFGEVVYG